MGQRIVKFSAEIVTQWMVTGNEIHVRCVAGVPADAQLVRAYPETKDGVFAWVGVYESIHWLGEDLQEPLLVVFTHASFPKLLDIAEAQLLLHGGGVSD